MKLNKIIIPIIVFLILLQIAIATPNSMNIQGKLTDSSGLIKTGTFNFTFRIYDNFTSGNKLYETNATATADSRGVYDVILENIDLPFDKQYYLALKVNADSEMEPRVNLTSVPYSFKANASQGLNTTENVFVNNEINLTSTGNVDASGTVNADILKAITQVDVGGGFSAGGLTIQSDGNIVTQGDILFSGNITILNVTHLSVNGSILPDLDDTFDLGNGSLRWRNANFSGFLEVLGNLIVDEGTLFVDSANDNVGIGTVSPSSALEVNGDIELTNLLDTDASSFFDLTGCGTSATFTALDSTGAVSCSAISITESQISDLSQVIFTLANVSNDTLRISENASIALWNASGADLVMLGLEKYLLTLN